MAPAAWAAGSAVVGIASSFFGGRAAKKQADKAAKARMQKKALGNAKNLNRSQMDPGAQAAQFGDFPSDGNYSRDRGTDFPAAPPPIVF